MVLTQPLRPVDWYTGGTFVMPNFTMFRTESVLALSDDVPEEARSREEQEEQLIQRARQGDPTACHRLLTRLLAHVQRIARIYTQTYQWLDPSLDWQDLVQNAYEEMMHNLDRALAKEQPTAYLVGIARSSIRRICHRMDHPTDNGTRMEWSQFPTDDSLRDRNTFLMERLEVARPMLWNMAYKSGCEYEELRHHAALVLLEKYERIQAAANPAAYAQSTIHNALITMLKKAPTSTLSLDTPISDQTRTTYADLLAAPSERADATMREDALYAALSLLPLEEQVYLCRVNNISESAYLPTPPTSGRFAGQAPDFTRSSQSLSKHAYNWLRHDPDLAAAICPDAYRENPEPFSSPEQRIEQAIMHLQGQGQSVTAGAIAEVAHLGTRIVSDYLHKRQGTQPVRRKHADDAEAERKMRMDEAYAALKSRGEKLTARSLALESGVHTSYTCVYLREREPAREALRQERVLSEPVELRLEHAAALLQSQGKAVSIHAIREVAHVGKRNAQAYLDLRRRKTGMRGEQENNNDQTPHS